MNKKLFWLPALLAMMAMSSCTEDDNGMNGPYRSWVTVYTNDNTPTLKTDRDFYLHVTNAQGDSTFYEVGDRGNMLYTLVDATASNGVTYQVVMNEFVKATIKDFVNDTDSTYEDTPLAAFSGASVSDNYLNVLVKTFRSNSPVNTLELVRYPSEETHVETDSLPVIRIRLQHNAKDVNATKTTQAVCFDLSPIRNEFPGKNGYVLRFSWKATNNQYQEYDLRYSPSN